MHELPRNTVYAEGFQGRLRLHEFLGTKLVNHGHQLGRTHSQIGLVELNRSHLASNFGESRIGLSGSQRGVLGVQTLLTLNLFSQIESSLSLLDREVVLEGKCLVH